MSCSIPVCQPNQVLEECWNSFQFSQGPLKTKDPGPGHFINSVNSLCDFPGKVARVWILGNVPSSTLRVLGDSIEFYWGFVNSICFQDMLETKTLKSFFQFGTITLVWQEHLTETKDPHDIKNQSRRIYIGKSRRGGLDSNNQQLRLNKCSPITQTNNEPNQSVSTIFWWLFIASQKNGS